MNSTRSRLLAAAAPLIFVVATALLYGRALGFGLLADDFDLLAGATAEHFSLADAFPAGSGRYWRPTVVATLRMTEALAAGPWLHHLVNLLLHLGNALLVRAGARALGAPRRHASWLGLAFLVHPVVVTDVFWISGRTDSLATLGVLVALLAGTSLARGRGGPAAVGLTLLGGALGLASKEVAVSLPGLFAGALLLGRRRGRLGSAASFAAAGVTATTLTYLGWLLVRFYADGLPERTLPLWRLLAQLPAAFALLVLPVPDHLLGEAARTAPLALAPFVLVLVGLVGLGGWRLLRLAPHDRRRIALVCGTVAVAAAPVAWMTTLSSRLLYLPLAVGLLLGGAITRALLRGLSGRMRAALASTLLVALAVGTTARTLVFAENDARIEQLCVSFRDLLPGVPEPDKLVLLSFPDRRLGERLFANDANRTLFHCATGRLGRYRELLEVGAIVERGRSAAALEPLSDEPWLARRVVGDDSHVELWPDARAGESRLTGDVEVEVLETAMPGRVQSFRIRLPDDVRPVVEYADGRLRLVRSGRPATSR